MADSSMTPSDDGRSPKFRHDRVEALATAAYRADAEPMRRLADDLGPEPSVEQLAERFGVKPTFLVSANGGGD